jgi:hypothetical protein
MKRYMSETNTWVDDDVAAMWWECYEQFVEDRRQVAAAIVRFEGQILDAIGEGQGQVMDADTEATSR